MSSVPFPPLPAIPSTPKKRSRTRLIVLLSLSAAVAAVILWSLGKGTYHDYRLASAAVEHFHQQLNAVDYDGIYEDASDELRRSASREDIVKLLEKVHQKMGNSGKTSPAGFHVNWKNGLTTVDQVFETEFAMGRGQESFVWIIRQDQLRLFGYHVDSPLLQ
jgi:hypothetical protein